MSIYTYNMYVKKKNSLTMKKYKFLFHKTIEKSWIKYLPDWESWLPNTEEKLLSVTKLLFAGGTAAKPINQKIKTSRWNNVKYDYDVIMIK